MQQRQQGFDPTGPLILLCWATAVLPRLVQTMTAPKYRTTVDAPVPYSRLSDLADRGLGILLLGFCIFVVLRGARNLPGDRRGILLAMVAPWVFMVIRDLYLDGRPDLDGMAYPFVVLAVWVLRPKLERLSLLGGLIGFTALLSIALGWLLPAKGVFASDSGSLIAPEKQILPWGILVGPLTDGNNLAQLLVLGLPAVLLIHRFAWRSALFGTVVFAIVWTSSRSSLVAIVTGTLAALVLTVASVSFRKFLAWLLMLTSLTVLVVLPVLNSGSNDAFNNRGYIWRISLQAFGEHIFLGHGSSWYSDVARYANSLGGNAFHGHNQFIQTVVVGGVIYTALTAALMAVLIASAARWAAAGQRMPAAYLITFFTSCTLEVSFGVVDRGFLIPVTVLVMAFIALSERIDGPVLRITRPVRGARRPVVELTGV